MRLRSMFPRPRGKGLIIVVRGASGTAPFTHSTHPPPRQWYHPQHGSAIVEASVEATRTSSRRMSPPPTHLTCLSHRSPLRLVPLRASCVERAGASMVYLANYGGGLVSGDRLEVHVTAHPRATLAVLAQGNTRVYGEQRTPRARTDTATRMTQVSSHYRVHEDALLVVAPDPMVVRPARSRENPSVTGRLEQVSRVDLQSASASCVVIDWLERRAGPNKRHTDDTGQPQLSTSSEDRTLPLVRTQLRCYGPDQELRLMDAMALPQQPLLFTHNGAPGEDASFASVASMLLAGPKVKAVLRRCQHLQTQLLRPWTSVRHHGPVPLDGPDGHTEESSPDVADATEQALSETLVSSLAGRVILGITKVTTQDSASPLHLLRWAAQSNQDLYRCLHYCLAPLASDLGLEVYRDRVCSTQSATIAPQWEAEGTLGLRASGMASLVPDAAPTTVEGETEGAQVSWTSSPQASWNAFMLADSALPIGSFAHSAGLEAASQLGLLETLGASDDREGDDKHSREDATSQIFAFIQNSTQSMVQGSVPFVIRSHRLTTKSLKLLDDDPNGETAKSNAMASEWQRLDRLVHVSLVGNGPACRASLDQGRSVLRVANQLSTTMDPNIMNERQRCMVARMFQQLQAEMGARDDAGHLASVYGTLTACLQVSEPEACELFGFTVARDMVSAAVRLNLLGPMASVSVLSGAKGASRLGVRAGRHLVNDELWAGAVSWPLLDAVQMCHDTLAMRLFRT